METTALAAVTPNNPEASATTCFCGSVVQPTHSQIKNGSTAPMTLPEKIAPSCGHIPPLIGRMNTYTQAPAIPTITTSSQSGRKMSSMWSLSDQTYRNQCDIPHETKVMMITVVTTIAAALRCQHHQDRFGVSLTKSIWKPFSIVPPAILQKICAVSTRLLVCPFLSIRFSAFFSTDEGSLHHHLHLRILFSRTFRKCRSSPR